MYVYVLYNICKKNTEAQNKLDDLSFSFNYLDSPFFFSFLKIYFFVTLHKNLP